MADENGCSVLEVMWAYSASLLSRTNPAGQLLKEEAMHRLEVEILLLICLDQMAANLHQALCRLLQQLLL